MENVKNEKTDIVSVILDDHDLLNVFSNTLRTPTYPISSLYKEELPQVYLGRIQKIKCYVWKKLKDVLKMLANKVLILAVLAEYHLKNEAKKMGESYDDL
jgi:hypothetical protein